MLYELAATADLFLTNKLPGVRRKLEIEVEDIRAHNGPRTNASFPSPACRRAGTGPPCASAEAIEILRSAFAQRTLDEWRQQLADFVGQWAVVQDTLEAAADPQAVANGYVQECRTAAGVPFRLVAAPVQYDEEPAVPGRAPEFNEHGDEILSELGLDWEAIVDLKVRGIVA